MKKILFSVFSAAGIVAMLASCSAKPEKVTAMVAPGDKVAAVVVEFNKAVSAEQITADAFEVEGQEIVAAFVCDQDPTVCPEPKEECKGEKPECDSTKAECGKPEGCPEAKAECKGDKPECKKADCKECKDCKDCENCKPECKCPECKPGCCAADSSACCKPQAPAKPECKGKDGKFVVLVLKHECPEAPKAECDSTKACPEGKTECGKPEGCPEAKAECDSTKACPEAKAECDSTKKCEKPEIAVPEVSVKQVKDIAAADGTTLKAWSKAFKATAAAPAFMGPKGPKGPKHACKGEKPECEKPCEKAEPAK